MGARRPEGSGGRIVNEARWVLLLNLLTLQKCRRDEASREQAAATRPNEPAQMVGR